MNEKVDSQVNGQTSPGLFYKITRITGPLSFIFFLLLIFYVFSSEIGFKISQFLRFYYGDIDFFLPFILALISLILSIVSVIKFKSNPYKFAKWLGLMGIILTILTLIFMFLVVSISV